MKHITDWNDPEYSVLKNLLRFSKSIEISIDDYNSESALKTMYAINKYAPETKIYLTMDFIKGDRFNDTIIPDDLKIFSV